MRFDRIAFQQHFDVSRETIGRLIKYNEILEKWNPKINLISKSTLQQIWHRHFADSAQLLPHIDNSARNWLDIGSGAGFPGLLAAIIAKEKYPDISFTLVESDQRKTAFLLSVAAELSLSIQVVAKRIENIEHQQFDTISARAVASLVQLLEWAYPYAHKSTVLLFPKGNSYKSELTIAKKHWHIDSEIIQSVTDSGSVILRIEGLERVK